MFLQLQELIQLVSEFVVEDMLPVNSGVTLVSTRDEQVSWHYPRGFKAARPTELLVLGVVISGLFIYFLPAFVW